MRLDRPTLADHAAVRGRGPGILRTEGHRVGNGITLRCLLDVWAPSRSNPVPPRVPPGYPVRDWQEDTAPARDVNLVRPTWSTRCGPLGQPGADHSTDRLGVSVLTRTDLSRLG